MFRRCDAERNKITLLLHDRAPSCLRAATVGGPFCIAEKDAAKKIGQHESHNDHDRQNDRVGKRLQVGKKQNCADRFDKTVRVAPLTHVNIRLPARGRAVIFDQSERDSKAIAAAQRRPKPSGYFGARLARMRCSVRRCMLSRRAVSETLRLHIS